MTVAAPTVRSIDEEDAAIGMCPRCSRRWRWSANDVLAWNSRWFDHLVFSCASCGHIAEFTFDVTSFFVPRSSVYATLTLPPVSAYVRRRLRFPIGDAYPAQRVA